MKNKIYLFLVLLFSNVLHAQEYKVSECQVDISKVGINEYVSIQSDCINEALNDENSTIVKAYREIPKASSEISGDLIDIYRNLISSVLIAVIVMGILSIKNGSYRNQNLKRSDLAMKLGLAPILLTFINVNDEYNTVALEFLNRQLHNSLLVVTSINNLHSQSEEMILDEVNKHQQIITDKSDELILSMVSSQTCAMEYQQNTMNRFSMKDGASYEMSDIAQCIEAVDPSFETTGRSGLNNAVRQCSVELSNIMDCGKVVINNPELKSVVSKYNAAIAEWLVLANASLCEGQDKQKATGFCREINNGEFSLIKEIKSVDQVNADYINLVSNFRTELRDVVVDNIDIVKEQREVVLLNLLDQTFSLIRGNNNFEGVGFQIETMLSDIIAIQGYQTDSVSNGYVDAKEEKENSSIQTIDDFYDTLNRDTVMLMSNKKLEDDVFMTSLFRYLNDPMLYFGNYAAESTKEGYKLDFFTQKSVYNMGLYSFTAGFVAKSLGSRLISSTSGMQQKKAASMLVFIGDKMMMASAIVFAPMVLIAYTMVNIVLLLFTAFIMTIVSIVLILVTKKPIEVVIDEIAQLWLSAFTKMFSFAAAMIFTHFLMVVVLSATTQIYNLQSYGVSVTPSQYLKFGAISIATIIFSSVVFFKLILFFDNKLTQKTTFRQATNNRVDNVDGLTETKNIIHKINRI